MASTKSVAFLFLICILVTCKAKYQTNETTSPKSEIADRQALIMTAFGSDKLVKINARTTDDTVRFDINVRADRDDVHAPTFLHLAFYLDNYVLIANYLNPEQGGWSVTDEAKFFDLPINAGDAFEIVVVSDVDAYKVHINGNYFCEFKKFMSDMGNKVCIDVCKDVEVTAMAIENRL